MKSLLRQSGAPYVTALVLGVLLSHLGAFWRDYVWPGMPRIFEQGPEIYLVAFMFGIAVALWVAYDGRPTRQPFLRVFLGLLLLTWIIEGVLSRLHEDSPLYSVWLTPLAIVGLLLKTPRSRDLLRVMTVLAWCTALALVIVRALQMLGAVPDIHVGHALLAFEQRNYWLPLADALGLEGRWHGPFGHAARTGAAAAFLVVFSVGHRSRGWWILAAIGLATLLLTASRGSMFAAAAGACVVLVLGDNPVTRRLGRVWVFVMVAVPAVVAIAGVLARNPELTGRTTYWAVALDVWQSSKVVGLGTNAAQSSALAIAGSNAHNIFVDALVKYGVVGLAAVVAVVTTAAIGAALAWRRTAVPLALGSTYIVLGMSEADTEWLRMTLPWIWLILAAVLAGTVREPATTTAPVLESRRPSASRVSEGVSHE